MHAPLDLTLRTEWRAFPALDEIASDWRALAARAIEPNVFYEPAFARAAATVFGKGAGAVLVWSKGRRLVGLFPGRIERRYGPFPKVLTGWVHPYGPLGTPLVDRDAAQTAIGAWLDHVAQDEALPGILLMPFLPDRGLFANAFHEAIAQRALKRACFGSHARALLEIGARKDGLEAVPSKLRKELGRKRRRLEETGIVTRETSTAGQTLQIAMAEFFALEASGWKGRAGTAAAMRPEILGFVEQAMGTLGAEGKARVDMVRLDGAPVAAILTLRSGDTAWAWKIAYDELFARFSPAVQLMLDVTQSLLAQPDLRRADSCATPDHPMIDHFWRERLALSDYMIGLRPGIGFALACGFETARRGALTAAKGMNNRAHRIAKALRRGRARSAG